MAQPLVAPDPASVSVPVRTGSSLVPVPVGRAPDVLSDCERLDAYRVAVEFQLLAASICSGRRLGALRDQLDRASAFRRSRSLLIRIVAMLTRLVAAMRGRSASERR